MPSHTTEWNVYILSISGKYDYVNERLSFSDRRRKKNEFPTKIANDVERATLRRKIQQMNMLFLRFDKKENNDKMELTSISAPGTVKFR